MLRIEDLVVGVKVVDNIEPNSVGIVKVNNGHTATVAFQDHDYDYSHCTVYDGVDNIKYLSIRDEPDNKE